MVTPPPSPHRYNLKPTPKGHPLWDRPWYHEIREALLDARRVSATAPAPNLIDWSPGVPPILDQQNEGSCAGHQIRNIRRLSHWRATGEVTPFDYSPAFPYWTGREIEGTVDTDSGMSLGDGLVATETNGICEATFMPYVPGEFRTPPSDAAFANALIHRGDLQHVPVEFSSFANLHQVMADGHLLIGGFRACPSFEACGSDGVLPDPRGEENLGGHAFSLSQINLADSWMDDPNSWGLAWGKLGHGYMPATYLERVIELWALVPCL